MKFITAPAQIRPAERKTRKGAKALLVCLAAAALAGLGAGAAAADSTSTTATDGKTWTVDAYSKTLAPWESVTIPSMSCQFGYLQDVDKSPGRWVVRGVEVIEPGGVGVTITSPMLGYGGDPNGDWAPIIGTDSVNAGMSTATNWDPFSSHELTIKLHCTSDIEDAARKNRIPGFASI